MERSPDGQPRGLDVAVAQRVGRALGRPIEFHWCGGAECSWHCLPEGRCDVVAGQPLGSGPPRGVAWSVPYAGARFGLVVPRDAHGISTLADLRGQRIGLVAGTVAVAEKDHSVARFKTREEVLDGFHRAGLHAALLDADFAAWYLHEHPQLGLRLVPEYVPRERWNMAFAVRAQDAQLLVEINRALARLAESGEVRKIYAELGVPYQAPFTAAGRPANPAPETWRRVRERGELVVSMDPANLPYSAAKEDRPGFDVELARALADRLGVRLRLDWLDVHRETAVGELIQGRCDLVLGEAVDANAVADDEPLAGKVLYSRPTTAPAMCSCAARMARTVRSLAELKGAQSRASAPRPARSPITTSGSGATSASCSATSWPPSRPSAIGRSTSPTSGPMPAGPCTSRPTSPRSSRSSRASRPRSAGASRSPCGGAMMSSNARSTRRSRP